MNQRKRVVVMTGATEGIGAHALRHIIAKQDTQVILGSRTKRRKKISPCIEEISLDLASIQSVHEFADELTSHLGEVKIDVLVLNPNIRLSNTDIKSDDGYELTFAANHLAHYLLVRLLLAHMAEFGRIVITTRDTINPNFAPETLEPIKLAHPLKTGFGTGMHAYNFSKLCNLMTVLSLNSLPEVKTQKLTIIAFDPGLRTNSFMRLITHFIKHNLFRLASVLRTEIRTNTPEYSGKVLAELALGVVKLPKGKSYISLVKRELTYPTPSSLARQRDAQIRLWEETEIMVGIRFGIVNPYGSQNQPTYSKE
ncbi:MAG: SDR family NAD(P)-dependent oxidoreductase [Pseudomonadales bacterium]|nr:SDR family NAD(P)-dependent oxidoreductase [Pseudomonadales bacterium]